MKYHHIEIGEKFTAGLGRRWVTMAKEYNSIEEALADGCVVTSKNAYGDPIEIGRYLGTRASSNPYVYNGDYHVYEIVMIGYAMGHCIGGLHSFIEKISA
jgi:hypothetical protein